MSMPSHVNEQQKTFAVRPQTLLLVATLVASLTQKLPMLLLRHPLATLLDN